MDSRLLATIQLRSLDLIMDIQGRNPVLALPGFDVHDVHGVNLLKGATKGLVDEEISHNGTQGTASSKHITIPIVNG